uniref:Large ribosomal subunit protein eL24-related N-terminal domain-containing protein n=1 Tax=Theropithecus gelada TaxID=9565 RepID=A0A8D2FZJ5_THEGE
MGPTWLPFSIFYINELCNHQYKVHAGHGRRYARTKRKVFQFLNAKCESAFFSKGNPRQINCTVLYRRKHKKGQLEEIQKERTRRAVKLQGAITGASLADIMAKRNQNLKLERLNENKVSGLLRKQKKAKRVPKKTAMAAAKVPTKAAPKLYFLEFL